VGTESRLTVDDVRNKTGESDVPIFTIGLGPEADPLPLERLATLTGGRYLEAPTAADIVTNFNAVADQLRKQYVLTFESDMPANHLRHTLSLNVSFEGKTGEDTGQFIARSRPGEAIISIPANGEEVEGQIVISPTLQMPGRVAQVSLLVDSALQETIDSPPFTFLWDTSQAEVGDHTLLIQASDHVGNRAEASTTISVVPTASTEPALKAAIIEPHDGDELTEPTRLLVEIGEVLHGVRNVEFWINDELLDSRQQEPYQTMWDISDLEPGQYTLSAMVYDNLGNRYEDNVQVTVNPPPVLLASLTNLTSGQTISQRTRLVVSIDQSAHGVSHVEFLDDGAVFAIDNNPPYEVIWDVDDLERGEHILSARVYDSQGNLWEDDIKVMVAPSRLGWPISFIYLIGGLLIAFFGLVAAVVLVSRHRPKAQEYSQQSAPENGARTHPEAVSESLATTLAGNGTSELASSTEETLVDQPSTEILDPLEATKSIDAEEDEAAVKQAGPSTWFDQIVTDQPTLPKAYIIGAQGPAGQIQEFPLFEREVTIGRSKDVDIMLLDAKVSRYHAKIVYENGEFVFKDSQPTNPSYINGAAYSDPHTIKDGDEFIIGRVKLIFRRAG